MFDAAIVLGGGVTDKDLKARVNKALELFRKGKVAKIIMSGRYDLFQKGRRTEAEKMKQYAIIKGLAKGVILKEEESRDTVGNAVFTLKHILKPKKWKKVIVVTSDYHMPRTRFIFKHVLGGKYAIEFIESKVKLPVKERREIERREQKLFTFTRDFARFIPIGNVAVIEKMLFSNHPLYKITKQKDL